MNSDEKFGVVVGLVAGGLGLIGAGCVSLLLEKIGYFRLFGASHEIASWALIILGVVCFVSGIVLHSWPQSRYA